MKKLLTTIALASVSLISAHSYDGGGFPPSSSEPRSQTTQRYPQRTAPVFQPSEQNQKALAYNYPQPTKQVAIREPSSNQEPVKSQHDTAKTETDRQINAQIRNKISTWIPNSLEAIILKTDDGAVTIIGAVDDYDAIKKLSDQIKRVSGVRSLNNQVIVRNNVLNRSDRAEKRA